MDKEQQIEEIAKIICNTCREKHIGVSKNCKCSREPCLAADIHSEVLYNAGYRKVDKDEEIKKLQAENKILSIQNKNLCKAFDKLNERTEKREAKNNQFLENMKNVLEIEKRSAVKEFAEKIKDYINDKVMEDFDDSDSVEYYTFDLDEFESKLDELVKEYENDK